MVKIESDSSLFTGSRFPKHSERIVFCVFRVVPNVSASQSLGKLMCCHYTTAAKNKNRQPFPVYSAFGDIASDSIQLHRFALTFIPKWQQVATIALTRSK